MTDRHPIRVHRYETVTIWSGSTSGGYRSYGRTHLGTSPGIVTPLLLSADSAFRGDDERLNPEELVVLATSSCQLLSFLACCARADIDVLSYRDAAVATMTEATEHMRLDEIVLRPEIRLAAGTDLELVAGLVDQAHHECYVANSLAVPVQVVPTIITGGAAPLAPLDLDTQISLTPHRRPGEFVVVSVENPPAEIVAFMRLEEEESTTLIVERAEANRLGLSYGFVGCLISLGIESAYDAVAITAVVATRLATAGIACNVLAGFHHDHLLVPLERAEEALDLLARPIAGAIGANRH